MDNLYSAMRGREECILKVSLCFPTSLPNQNNRYRRALK